MLTHQDIQQLHKKGIEPSQIDAQINNFKNGFPYVDLISAATCGNGIRIFDEIEINRLAEYYNVHGPDSEVVKFVPASGAASRMFKSLFEFMETYVGSDEDIKKFEADQGFDSVYNFIKNIRKFAFIEDLEDVLEQDGLGLDVLLDNKQYGLIIEYLLTEKGLNYSNLPKGLLKFHLYDDFPRMPLGEHLVEGAHYARRSNGDVFVHFTVSPEHKEKFLEAIDEVLPRYEDVFKVKYHISFSEQKPSTDTLAVDMDNEPFREKDGSLLFRPGGHGALIENLNDLDGEVIFVKNIDNVVPDRLKEPTYLYKKVIGGLLLKLQKQTFEYLELLEDGNLSDEDLQEIAEFAQKELLIRLEDYFEKLDQPEKIDLLYTKLNRPMRVCGMVKNEGEPGGGPFWLKNSEGDVSLQIVESSQIDLKNADQNRIVQDATHFNPVDLVCGIRDFKGNKFDLRKFVDPSTGFISTKSKDGKNLKAQELPGLWNGAMADWTTVFVEAPIITFNPVKTVNDLLREQHLNP
jgi:hypothetical protein